MLQSLPRVLWAAIAACLGCLFTVAKADVTPTAITCGSTINGSTVGLVNDAATYSCRTWNESGPDQTFVINVAQKGLLRVQILDLSADLDVFITTANNATTCIGSGDYEINQSVNAGTYYIHVDGFNGAAGSFTLKTTCTCAGAADPCFGDYISRVKVYSTLSDSVTACNANAYAFANNNPFYAQVGVGSPFRISHANVPQYDQIFIDLNNDGDFSDAGELIYNSPDQVVTRTGSLLIPTLQAINPDQLITTRMRVRCSFYAFTGSDPCAPVTYGDTRDFSITVDPVTFNPDGLIARFCPGNPESMAMTKYGGDDLPGSSSVLAQISTSESGPGLPSASARPSAQALRSPSRHLTRAPASICASV